jgi:hypothetical protein
MSRALDQLGWVNVARAVGLDALGFPGAHELRLWVPRHQRSVRADLRRAIDLHATLAFEVEEQRLWTVTSRRRSASRRVSN